MTNPELIIESVAQIDEVYRYTKGERVLPLQDPLLEQKYTEAISRYFEYCKTALTDPDIVRLMQKGRVGLWDGFSPPYPYNYGGPHIDDKSCQGVHIARMIDGVHIIDAWPSNDYSFILSVNPSTRLLLSAERELSYQEAVAEREEIEWKNRILEKYAPVDSSDNWEFIKVSEKGYVFGHRTLRVEDILSLGLGIPSFVNGVRHTFAVLKDVATAEAAEKFAGISDVERIQAMIDAFDQANGILEKVFNPTAASAPQTTSTPRSRRQRKS